MRSVRNLKLQSFQQLAMRKVAGSKTMSSMERKRGCLKYSAGADMYNIVLFQDTQI